jgi:hypothetical protein
MTNPDTYVQHVARRVCSFGRRGAASASDARSFWDEPVGGRPKSILEAAAALRRQEALRAEVAALDADEDDRREMEEVASLMESLRAER